MSEEKIEKNNEAKKEGGFILAVKSFVKKIIILAIITAGGFGAFKFWQKEQAKKEQAIKEVKKFDNIDSEIIELSDEDDDEKYDDDLSKISSDEMKERGVEFIYQNLLQHQVELDDLRGRIRDLEDELAKHKARKVIGRVIYSYVDFRQKLYAGEKPDKEFENFLILTSFDEVLQNKARSLKDIYAQFHSERYLSEKFTKLIPSLIALENNNPNSGLVERVRFNISKLVTIRQVKGEDISGLDDIILQTQNHLKNEEYEEALAKLEKLDRPYQELMDDFIKELEIASELQILDQEILSYLRVLS